MRRTEEWLAEQRAKARAWNGHTKPESNAEPVKLARKAAAVVAEPLYPLVGLCEAAGLPVPVPEYHFAKPRKWRADYAWPLHKVMLEVNGGVWTQGRHNRGAGAIADQEKLSEAAILGWRVLYAIPDDLRNGVALGRVMRALA